MIANELTLSPGIIFADATLPSRWLLLKREENLKTEQRFRLRDLLRYNLKTVRAYLIKEAFISSGITTRPHGPESSSMTGVGK